MSKLKIILLCSNRFALPVLKELAFFNILGAIAIPKQYDEMVEHVEHVIQGLDIPLLELDRHNFATQLTEAMSDHEINMGLVVTFPYKIPSVVYAVPANGFYNIHPGPLPAYRGRDPVFQQIRNREKYAAVTIHELDDGFDTGPVVACEVLRIDYTDTYGILTTKLAALAANLTGALIRLKDLGMSISARPQDESKARYYPKQSAKDISINWQTMSAMDIRSLIQACNPWNKGAVTKMNNEVIRLLEAKIISVMPEHAKEPGTIISIDATGMLVATLAQEALLVGIVYTEEGFLLPGGLPGLGIEAGNRFEVI